MDKTLHIVEHLYGEDSEADLQELLQDDALQAEYNVLCEVKAALDQRLHHRPEAGTFDAIMAAAIAQSNTAQSNAAPPVSARADRPAKPRATPSRFRMIGALAATFALLITVGIVFTQTNLTGSAPALSEQAMSIETSEEQTSADRMAEKEAPAAMESDAAFADAAPSSAPPTDDADQAKSETAGITLQRESTPQSASATGVAEEETRGASSAERSRTAPAVASAAMASVEHRANPAAPDSLPAWDEAGELREIHRGIELLQARSADDTWDDPAVMSLDVLPSQQEPSRLDRGLNTVGTKRTRDNQ